MKGIFKKAIMLVAIVMILFIFAKEIYAYTNVTYYVLNGGVGNYGTNRRYYYIDSSCNVGNNPEYIETAWNQWINTTDSVGVTTSISVRRTTTQADSSFDFYYLDTNLYSTLDAWTEHYHYNDFIAINPNSGAPSANWGWAKININSKNYSKLPESQAGTNLNIKKYVLAHEIGHAMGLWHVNPNSINEQSIMLDLKDSTDTEVDSCQKYDLDNINNLYN